MKQNLSYTVHARCSWTALLTFVFLDGKLFCCWCFFSTIRQLMLSTLIFPGNWGTWYTSTVNVSEERIYHEYMEWHPVWKKGIISLKFKFEKDNTVTIARSGTKNWNGSERKIASTQISYTLIKAKFLLLFTLQLTHRDSQDFLLKKWSLWLLQ